MNHFMKTFTSVLLGAVTLACLATGCVREQIGNDLGPEKKDVTVKFSLTINSAARQETKMTAENTQANGNNFLGMQDVHILTYKLGDGNTPSGWGTGTIPATTGDNAVVGKFYFNPAAAGKATEDYNFGRLFDAGSIITSGDNQKESRICRLDGFFRQRTANLGSALCTSIPERSNRRRYRKTWRDRGFEDQARVLCLSE